MGAMTDEHGPTDDDGLADDDALTAAEHAARWRRVADDFTARVEGADTLEPAPDGTAAWDEPAPCDGWVARDVVRHLVEWVPPFFAEGAGLAFTVTADVDTDPVSAWRQLESAVTGAFDGAEDVDFSHPMAGECPLPVAIERFVTADVLVHTWDLARATGQDETIDADIAADALAGMTPIVDVLVASGHYGEPTPVPDGADVQTRLIALTGRTP